MRRGGGWQTDDAEDDDDCMQMAGVETLCSTDLPSLQRGTTYYYMKTGQEIEAS